MRVFWILSVCVAALSGWAESVEDRYWPQWRGPLDSGSNPSGRYAIRWTGDSNLEWKLALPGKGCSTPIVLGRQIILTTPLDGQDAVISADWKGEISWRTSVGTERKGKHRNGSGSNPSPATDGKGIYVYFKSGNLAGLDLEGRVKWRVNLQRRFGRDSLYWDLGTSPVLAGSFVVVAVMHDREGYLAAFEKLTGNLAWKADRTYATPVEGDHSYATPLAVKHQGREAVVVWGAERLTAHDSEDGEMLWSCGGFNPDRRKNWVAVASPVVAGNVAVVPYGRGAKLAGIRLGGSGDVTQTHRLWEMDGVGSFVPTPAATGGLVYVLRDRGEVVAVAPLTGEVVWKGQLPEHRASYYASPVVADSKIYAAREDGVVVVASLGPELRILAENDLGERIIASPVPVDGFLLLRGEKHLFCVKAEE